MMSRSEHINIETTAEAAATAGGGSDAETVESAEILAISERIRAALECPICLLLIDEPTCRCPNGHVICYSCLIKLRSMDVSRRCPMCRSPMARGPHLWCTATVLAEFMGWLKVTCSYREFGCDELVPVASVVAHEATCTFTPDVRCQLPTCLWVGVYDDLFEHVSRTHPAYAVRSTSNNLVVNDAKDILFSRRRSYLVETPHGLFWVLLSVETRSRIRVSVLMVPDPEISEESEPSQGPHGMVYRVSWGDDDGKCKNRSRIRHMGWSSSPKRDKVTDTYAMIRCRAGRLQIIWYDRHPSSRRTQTSSPPTTEVVAASSLTT